jgi:hypothetical protein
VKPCSLLAIRRNILTLFSGRNRGRTFIRSVNKHTVACRDVSRKRLGKQVTSATDRHATIEVLLKTVFSTRSAQMSYKEDNSSVGREPPFRQDLSPETEE